MTSRSGLLLLVALRISQPASLSTFLSSTLVRHVLMLSGIDDDQCRRPRPVWRLCVPR